MEYEWDSTNKRCQETHWSSKSMLKFNLLKRDQQITHYYMWNMLEFTIHK